MAKIVIGETDQTKPGLSQASTDVVYIPGFVDLAQLYDKTGNYTGIELNVPTLFTSLTDFETLVGKRGAVFENTQFYADLTFKPSDEGSDVEAFPEVAIPTGGVMFTKNSVDPSYIIAKELLKRGLPVLYERINSDKSEYKEITVEQKDFNLYTLYTQGEDGNFTKATTYSQDADYYILDNKINIVNMYEALNGGIYSNAADAEGKDPGDLSDKGEYTLKFITSGGYPTFEYANNQVVTKMVNLAKDRGDCVAIIDHTRNIDRSTNPANATSVYKIISDTSPTNPYRIDETAASFATMFTPYMEYARLSTDSEYDQEEANTASVMLPASFGYLSALATSVVNYPNWLAIAGVTRGKISGNPYVTRLENITNAVADKMQPRTGIAINSITNIKPYGLCVWGNRTLKNNAEELTATSFLNIRNMVSDVKKLAYTTAKKLTFEQNDDILWINFKAGITPLLDRLKSGAGISGYKIIKKQTDLKAKLVAEIIIYPLYAVEDFDITIVMQDQDVTVE